MAYAILFIVSSVIGTASGAPYNVSREEPREGWVSQPDGRGTFDILFSCLFTVFLCTWTALHLNVPALHETYWQQFRRKCRWAIQTIMAPEFVLGFASGQKVEAQRSVEMFRALGYKDWTVRHGFYANMGGFHLQAEGFPSFPINAKQLHYLVKRKYVAFPEFSAKDVWDKSKADGFQKLFTCIQTGWFIIQIIGRAIQHLPVTTLELTTLGFVFCTLVMYYQWADKPLDVARPTIIRPPITINPPPITIDPPPITTNPPPITTDPPPITTDPPPITTDPPPITIDQILIEGGDIASQPYKQTPLDFIDNLSPSWLTEAQPHLRFRRGPPERPLPRFTNDRFPVIGASLEAIMFFIYSMTYCSLHFIGWNFSFPTNIERTLWRSASITMVSSALVFWICETYQDGRRIGRWERWYARMFPEKGEKAYRMGLSPQSRKEIMFIPVWEVVIMIPVTFIYSLARSYIVIEIFLSQRSLPKGAFDTVDWSKYIPHI